MTVLFILGDGDGLVRAGRLFEADGTVTLRARGGRVLAPCEVSAVLLPPPPNPPASLALLHGAADAGYNLEGS